MWQVRLTTNYTYIMLLISSLHFHMDSINSPEHLHTLIGHWLVPFLRIHCKETTWLSRFSCTKMWQYTRYWDLSLDITYTEYYLELMQASKYGRRSWAIINNGKSNQWDRPPLTSRSVCQSQTLKVVLNPGFGRK